MTSPIGERTNFMRNKRGFTFVELILVMLLLTVLAAAAAPMLSRSFRGRLVDQEAQRLAATLQHGRQEATTFGVPVEVWVDVDRSRISLQAAPGFGTGRVRPMEYQLHEEIAIRGTDGAVSGRKVIRILPDGSFDPESSQGFLFRDGRGNESILKKELAAAGYRVVKEEDS